MPIEILKMLQYMGAERFLLLWLGDAVCAGTTPLIGPLSFRPSTGMPRIDEMMICSVWEPLLQLGVMKQSAVYLSERNLVTGDCSLKEK